MHSLWEISVCLSEQGNSSRQNVCEGWGYCHVRPCHLPRASANVAPSNNHPCKLASLPGAWAGPCGVGSAW